MLTDIQEQARDIIRDKWIDAAAVMGGFKLELHGDEPSPAVQLLAEALDDARAKERTHILRLLCIETDGGPDDPWLNLEGAIFDLQQEGANRICIETIKRVQGGLARVAEYADAETERRTKSLPQSS